MPIQCILRSSITQEQKEWLKIKMKIEANLGVGETIINADWS